MTWSPFPVLCVFRLSRRLSRQLGLVISQAVLLAKHEGLRTETSVTLVVFDSPLLQSMHRL